MKEISEKKYECIKKALESKEYEVSAPREDQKLHARINIDTYLPNQKLNLSTYYDGQEVILKDIKTELNGKSVRKEYEQDLAILAETKKLNT